MNRKYIFLIIALFFVILTTGYLFTQYKYEEGALKRFYNLTSEDPLFYSPFFNEAAWNKSIKLLKDSETHYKKTAIESFSKVLPHATGEEKNKYITTMQEMNIYPYEFLESLVSINKKTQEFLKNHSNKTALELLSLYEIASTSYIKDVPLKIRILKNTGSGASTTPSFYEFIDSSSNSNITLDDFLVIKENGEELKKEVAQRKMCLLAKNDCNASPQDNKKNEDFIDVLNAKFDLKGEDVDFIKENLPQAPTSQNIKGPYRITSSCWQRQGDENWMYLVFLLKNNRGNPPIMPKLATQNYYLKINTNSRVNDNIDKELLKNGLIFFNQKEGTTYGCPDLTFYPLLLTLDFVNDQIKSGKITEEDLRKKQDYRLLIENQFGLLAPAISTVSEHLNVLDLTSSINQSGVMPHGLISTRSVYSIFYFPFARSIWRINKKLKYFSSPEESPLNHTKAVTLDELKDMGYTIEEIKQFQLKNEGSSKEFYESLN